MEESLGIQPPDGTASYLVSTVNSVCRCSSVEVKKFYQWQGQFLSQVLPDTNSFHLYFIIILWLCLDLDEVQVHCMISLQTVAKWVSSSHANLYLDLVMYLWLGSTNHGPQVESAVLSCVWREFSLFHNKVILNSLTFDSLLLAALVFSTIERLLWDYWAPNEIEGSSDTCCSGWLCRAACWVLYFCSIR